MDHTNTKKVLRHVFVTGIIGDSIGTSIQRLHGTDRINLYRKISKLQVNAKIKGFSGSSDFSLAMLGTFNALRKRVKVNPNGIVYEARLFGGATGAAAFVSYKELTFQELVSLSKETCSVLAIDEQDTQLFTFLVWLIHTLTQDGYLRPAHFKQAQVLNLMSPTLCEKLTGLGVHQYDKKYMTLRIAPSDLLEGLTPYEQVLAKAVYYLFQSFSGWTTKPRFALDGVIVHDPNSIHDLLFMFSILCVASEHHYLLYTKPLQEQNTLVGTVNMLFDHL